MSRLGEGFTFLTNTGQVTISSPDPQRAPWSFSGSHSLESSVIRECKITNPKCILVAVALVERYQSGTEDRM